MDAARDLLDHAQRAGWTQRYRMSVLAMVEQGEIEPATWPLQCAALWRSTGDTPIQVHNGAASPPWATTAALPCGSARRLRVFLQPAYGASSSLLLTIPMAG
jgi:hypothetical protein